MDDLTYEQCLEEGRILAAPHDEEFERHLGMNKAHLFHAPHRKEFVHIYQVNSKKATPPKKGAVQPKGTNSKVLKNMMKYHGYEETKNTSKTRMSWSKQSKNKYHEIHADVDANGEPKTIYHKERYS